MIGDTWNTLVAPPTDRELDAAMAEVRVRAIGHARRRAWRGRTWTMLGVAILLATGWAGGAWFANPAGISTRQPRTGAWPGLRLSVARSDVLPSVATPVALSRLVSPVRYRITTWSELDGIRFNEGEGVAEGPAGTRFVLRMNTATDRIDIKVGVWPTADSVRYILSYFERHGIGYSRRRLPVVEEGLGSSGLAVRWGDALQFQPFGPPQAGEPATFVRIEGPDAPPPTRRVHWFIPKGMMLADFRTWMQVPENAQIAGARGVRVGTAGAPNMVLIPSFTPPPTLMRLSVIGVDRPVEVLAGAMRRFVLPGVSDTLAAWMDPNSTVGPVYACFGARRYWWGQGVRDRASGQPAFNVQGCFPSADPWSPITVTARNGQRVRVQLLETTPEAVRRLYGDTAVR